MRPNSGGRCFCDLNPPRFFGGSKSLALTGPKISKSNCTLGGGRNRQSILLYRSCAKDTQRLLHTHALLNQGACSKVVRLAGKFQAADPMQAKKLPSLIKTFLIDSKKKFEKSVAKKKLGLQRDEGASEKPFLLLLHRDFNLYQIKAKANQNAFQSIRNHDISIPLNIPK